MVEAPGLTLFLVLAGPAVGSFLALFAERWPRGQDVVRAPSVCRACGHQLTWREKLPIVSWLVQRGRCRQCGAAIPARLLQAELAGLAMPLAALAVAATPLHLLLGTLFLWLLTGLALSDVTAYRLPDPLTAALALTGAAMAWEHPARDLPDALLGGLVGGGVTWGLRALYQAWRGREGIGMGDVKLMAAVGAALGWRALPLVALVGALAGLAAALVVSRRRGRSLRADSAVPFGAWLCLAAGVVWLATA